MNKSIGPNFKYLDKIKEQEKIIDYLKSKYKETTGFEPHLPTHLASQSAGANQSMVNNRSMILPTTKSLIVGKYEEDEEEKYEVEPDNFYDAVAKLQLPHKLPPDPRKYGRQPKTNFDIKNKYHMIEVIDLSNFKGKSFTKAAFKEFLESIQEMRTLHTLYLRNNGINDSYYEELIYLVSHCKLQGLDISENDISPKGIDGMLQQMKSGYGNFRYLNLARNSFSHNFQTVSTLLSALLQQRDLLRVNVDAYKNDASFRGGDLLCKLAEQHKGLVNLTISDSLITREGMQTIAKGLNHSHSFLKELSFKFCFLHKEQVRQLMQNLTTNQSIVYLDLKHNGIDNAAGHYISQMLCHNFTLHALNLENNSLGDDFIDCLCPALRKNNVLNILKLGYNNIGSEGAKQLLSLLGADNDSIDDFGEIGNNPMGMGYGEQINTKIKKNMQMNGREIEDLGNYKVTKPINFIESLSKKAYKFSVWDI